MFSIWGPGIDGASFLDLFAGAGSVGLEALSRGAVRVVFVERSGRTLSALDRNCRAVAEKGWQILAGDVPRDLGRLLRSDTFDYVFADPPYGFDKHDELAAGMCRHVARFGEAAIEHSTRHLVAEHLQSEYRVERRVYGESALTILRLRKGNP